MDEWMNEREEKSIGRQRKMQTCDNINKLKNSSSIGSFVFVFITYI
jgi:hypothetical protein